MSPPNGVIFIVGPTAIGKTDVALELARLVDSEVVSADSRQVYRYMDIGTAKPSTKERSRVPHHFIDVRNPDEYYSAGEFGTEARACIRNVISRRKQPLVVGGSGLYVQALANGLSAPKIASAEVKANLKEETQNNGLGFMYEKLLNVDPVTAERLNPTDTQRILRALEVNTITGRRYSDLLDEKPHPADFRSCFFGLTLDREQLYRRIERRVDLMLEAGFLEEVERLREMGYGPELNALQSIGYEQAFHFLDEQLTHAELGALMKQKTRNFAKRQLTWFRKDERIQWLSCEQTVAPALAERIYREFLAAPAG